MIQSKSRRKTKNEVHLCEFCQKKDNCKAQPPKTEWKDVLKSCQGYEEVEIDYFTGGHSR
ncbi:hypothetical protein CVD28_03950 [Bacillus sp. M6-12]|uniref:hypothetical protein n=1 Tax=Bacillus sp. M6-12 TaxID=2054166 RepID=UPI000C792DBD|nr:hypothetical protein [Bacillus sp. M6-12]PLS19580.1 hypothetical protein CVD28_03950 [Bacillus sp. M6-12]